VTACQVIELIGSSSDSWEFAAQNAVREAAPSYPRPRVAELVEMDVLIENGTIIAYRTKLRLSYNTTRRLNEATGEWAHSGAWRVESQLL